MANQYSLEWRESSLGELQPQWSYEPSLEQIERISRQQLRVSENAICKVKFLTGGAFNKLFTVETDTGRWLMRVALPVDPFRKTASEVATMSFVHSRTGIPIPAVFGHDASNQSGLGFEWILMEHMPGTVLKQLWRSLSMPQKEALVKKLAQFQSELCGNADRFHAIGNIIAKDSESYEIRSIVSMAFFWSERGARAVARGPFKDSHEWLSARLGLVIEDQDKLLASCDDEDEIEVARVVKALTERLLSKLPQVFPADEVESTMLFHGDLHQNNIMVDESGTTTAILDWKCVSVLPLWMSCQPPALLNGKNRNMEPQKQENARFDPDVDEDDSDYNQGMSSLYWERLEMYESGKLRQVFLTEMQSLQSAWFTA